MPSPVRSKPRVGEANYEKDKKIGILTDFDIEN